MRPSETPRTSRKIALPLSAHRTALRDVLLRASPGALLALVDEMASDTDPREGAALAAAVLEELLERGATVLVTTHLEELKAPGSARGGQDSPPHTLDSDPNLLAPTYRLHLGSPGASSAIDIAARVGLPEAICQRARTHLRGVSGPLAQALESLEETRRALDRERVEALRLMAWRLCVSADAASRRLAEIEETGRQEAAEARQRLVADLQAAQVQVSALVAEAPGRAHPRQG